MQSEDDFRKCKQYAIVGITILAVSSILTEEGLREPSPYRWATECESAGGGGVGSEIYSRQQTKIDRANAEIFCVSKLDTKTIPSSHRIRLWKK